MSVNPRRLLASLTSVAAAVSLATLAAPPSPAGADDGGTAARVTRVSGSGTATPSGTSVATTFVMRNRTTSRQPATLATVWLVGAGRSHGLGTVRTPALAPGAKRMVRTSAIAPLNARAGAYRLRVCLSPRPGGACTATTRAVVRVAPPALVARPGGLNFAGTTVGSTSEPQDLRVTNTGHSRTGRVTVSVSGADADDFTVTPGSCRPLDPGASCTAQVRFAPHAGAASPRTASVRAVGGAGVAVTAALTGDAVTPVEAADVEIVPASWDYGSVAVGSSATHTFRLVNNTDSDAPLTAGGLSSYDQFGFDYVEGQNTCLSEVVPARGSCTFSVAFVPTAPGTFTTTAEFGAAGQLATSTLTGTSTQGSAAPSDVGRGRAAGHIGAYGS